MPGTRLNSTERALLRAWDGGRFGRFPLLKSISITAPAGRGLRGIRSLSVEFGFPVTFLSGQNGCGKSTLLSLAALAFHGHAGHIPSNSRRRAGSGAGEFGYYTFQDFFHRGPGDSDVSGVQICWGFSRGVEVSISKQSDKWMRYERRPVRPVEFLGLSRAVPAIELPTLRTHFGLAATPNAAPLTADARGHLGRILGRQYPSAEILSGSRYTIRRSGREGGYTSFNMGTGEDALIGLLARLEAVPEGTLVVIEELETGLHPAAQQRATKALIEIAWERDLQIIGSTHSHHVLDQLPRQARTLVIRESDSHRVVASPTTQFALSEMAETSESELLILCEDEFAAGLIQQMLTKALRRRVSVKSCGAKTELALQAQSHLRLVERARCLVFWDGDVTVAEAQGYIRTARTRFPLEGAEHRLSWSLLPGNTCPELWALNIARTIGLAEITEYFNFESDAEATAALARCGLGDPHAIAHELSQLVGLREEVVANGLAVCVAKAAAEVRDRLVATVQSVLDGEALAAAASPEGAVPA
ncbi:ATP-dependent nuclease [Azohydromonas australica]|uniref:ATP-dependent nuclease n=1 Tax=Azohydromonas australica TaxID=364039 RepID=UPI0004249009|nr:AAA family ATPase [Azohydromonas australica]